MGLKLTLTPRVLKYKEDGWLDWQIVVALYNNIINLKANYLLHKNGMNYTNKNEEIQSFRKILAEIKGKNENETHLKIPIDELIGEQLDFHIQDISNLVLRSFNLEDKSQFPNHKSIREFLNERFNFNKDDIINLSPFSNVNEVIDNKQAKTIEFLMSLNLKELNKLIEELRDRLQ